MNVLTVSMLNHYIKGKFVEDPQLSGLLVEGEISNFVNHVKSGHFYFTLKDGKCAVKAVMFRGYASSIRFAPQNGMKVVVKGDVDVFERDGVYQLYVYDMQPMGKGALYLAYEQLKAKLAAEGLFDERYKKPLPAYPKRVGVITSETGAVLQDIRNVLGRRYPLCRLVLCPSKVQGEDAAENLIASLQLMERYGQADVIIIGRGGGSIEDLWAFNDERLARAIFACRVPVVSAVGHETDFTIADFVSDLRAPTPSAAAELVSPSQVDLTYQLAGGEVRLYAAMDAKIEGGIHRLEQLSQKECIKSPTFLVDKNRQRLDFLVQSICKNMQSKMNNHETALSHQAALLNSYNPLGILSRGYSVVYKQGQIVKHSKELYDGDEVLIRLGEGSVDARIIQVSQEKE
ncbi:exodeoxyribonuclease VII large subunit [Zongyangia hominis]|uniref:Exodeoxyribonuclease 7 large subunit n=1 Tax=Zongyangia hominis TaxID=2763677 RepID=A0A926EC17_9FIRM|nr:exodeoxyribonuclease VII large subunit [Zongyangia hominis]MBC8569599.1 exodeoxyribonuclease VII large subunit [Zongyangia hominis]